MSSENPIVVEIGAFIHKTWPLSIIHAFEPVPQLFVIVQKNTNHYNNIHCYAYALSDQNGSALFHVSEKLTKPGRPSQAGSLRAPKERLNYAGQPSYTDLKNWLKNNGFTLTGRDFETMKQWFFDNLLFIQKK